MLCLGNTWQQGRSKCLLPLPSLVTVKLVGAVLGSQRKTLSCATAHLNHDSKIIPEEETNGHSAGMTCQCSHDTRESAAEPSCDNEQEIEVVPLVFTKK